VIRSLQSPAQAAAEKVAAHLGSWNAIELTVREDIILNKPRGRKATFNAVVERYVETAEGQRLYDTRNILGDALVGRAASYCDGSRCVDAHYDPPNLETRPTQVAIKASFHMEGQNERPSRPHPLRLFHVGRKPLDRALADSEHLGTERVIDRECDLFLFRQVKWGIRQDHVYAIDRDTGVPLRVVSFKDEAARGADDPLWSWTAESLDFVDGRPVVLKSIQVAPKSDDGAGLRRLIQVESVAFDRDYPASTFWPTIQPGVHVFDTIARRDYDQPGARPPAAPPAITPPIASVEAPTPIVAEPGTGWATYLKAGSLILGVALLVGGLILWWRRR